VQIKDPQVLSTLPVATLEAFTWALPLDPAPERSSGSSCLS
jgi:hypothetical protein